jgi:hypothetical protein
MEMVSLRMRWPLSRPFAAHFRAKRRRLEIYCGMLFDLLDRKRPMFRSGLFLGSLTGGVRNGLSLRDYTGLVHVAHHPGYAVPPTSTDVTAPVMFRPLSPTSTATIAAISSNAASRSAVRQRNYSTAKTYEQRA